MPNTLVGPLPRHLYCFADSGHLRKDKAGYEPVVWFGLVSHPGRVWGCSVMTEEGAIYRNLPPHAISFVRDQRNSWNEHYAQRWNCYGTGFTALIYPYLDGLECKANVRGLRLRGTYLFTVAPVGDAFSEYPEQAKEFTFVRLHSGLLTIQPTNAVLFREASFTSKDADWPTDLKRQTETFHCKE